MDEFDRSFTTYPRYRVIVCNKCQVAVIPAQVEEHLRKQHSRLSRQERHDIAERFYSFRNIALVESDVIYPKSSEPPLDALPIYFDGLKCTGSDAQGQPCLYICRTPCGIQQHCKEEHDWENKQKRGGDVRAKQTHSANKLWECNKACQRFFKRGKWQRYFEVAAGGQEDPTEHTANRRNLFFQAQKEELKKIASDQSEAANIVQGFDDHRSTVVPWLRETGIVKHIGRLKKDEIKAAISLPSPDREDTLREIIDAMDSLLREAHRICFDGTDCMLTWPCRVVLSRFQSAQVDMIGKTRAFDPYKEPGTLKTYFRTSQRFLSYFYRVIFPNEHYFHIEETRDEAQRPKDVVEATDEQLAVWNDIWQIARREGLEESDEEKKQTELKSRLLDMWIQIVCHNTGAQRYQSPLLSFCAMLSIKPSTQGWMEPGNFNSNLSAIIWVVQLLIFYDSARKEQQGRGETLTLPLADE